MQTGQVVETKIDDNDLRQYVVNCFGGDDRRNYYSLTPFGVDSVVPEGVKGLTSSSKNKDIKFLLGMLNKARPEGLVAGEVAIFSTSNDGGSVQSFINLKNDGTIEVNGVDDNMVRYSALEDAYNELNDKYNDCVTKVNAILDAFNNWVPVPQDGGAALQLLTAILQPAEESTGDITPAKIEEIKTT